MAKNNLIILNNFYDSFKNLKDENAGKLIKAIFEYHINGSLYQGDEMVAFAFNSIKPMLDESKQKYSSKCLKNKENAEMRWNANECERIQSDAKNANRIEENRREENIKDKIKYNSIFSLSNIHEDENFLSWRQKKLEPLSFKVGTDFFNRAYVNDMIEKIDIYCRQKNKKYKDYYATLQSWINRDIEDRKSKAGV